MDGSNVKGSGAAPTIEPKGRSSMPARNSDRIRAFQLEAMVHLDALYGVALRLTKHERDAEDLVQDTFLKAYSHFDKYKRGTNCKAWLFKILTNTFINRYRKRQKEKCFLLEDGDRTFYERIAHKPGHPLSVFVEDEADMFHKLFGDEVRRSLEELPVDFRMVVLLADLQDFSYKEVAEIMDCPIGTVMSRLYRGRRLLQSKLVEYAQDRGLIPRRVEDGSNTTDLDEYRRRKNVRQNESTA